jgi:hypothetical protein
VADLATFSPEWYGVLRRGRCPNGHRGPFEFTEGIGPLAQLKWSDRHLNASKPFYIGALIFPTSWGVALTPAYRTILRMPRIKAFREDSLFRCGQCNGNWKVISDADNSDHVVILGLTNARRSSVSMGYDDSIRDNRTGTENMVATIRVSRRWLQKVEVLWEEAQIKSTTERLTLSAKYAGTGIEQKIEQSLKSSLSLSSETEQVLEQTLQIPIPAHSQITVRIHWKQIWQEGQITAQFSDGTTAEIPYCAAVDVGFDQENIPR